MTLAVVKRENSAKAKSWAKSAIWPPWLIRRWILVASIGAVGGMWYMAASADGTRDVYSVMGGVMGGAIGGAAGAIFYCWLGTCVLCMPVSVWFLVLVMLGQIAESIRGEQP